MQLMGTNYITPGQSCWPNKQREISSLMGGGGPEIVIAKLYLQVSKQ
jgi:hypothetical protein